MTTATFNCQPPNQFDFSNVNDWPRWKSRFERFRSISGLKQKSEVEQIDCLVYSMGDAAEAILHALKLPEVDSKLYDKVISAFESHFIGKRNVIYERAKFNLRIQKESETVDEFITSLHNLAKYCEFGSLNDELIRDRIVAGVKENTLSEKMQLDSELTLEKATMIARQFERIKLQQSTVHVDYKDVKIERVKSANLKFRNDNSKPKRNYQPMDNSANKRSCFWCGGNVHKNKKECPASNATCNKCKKRGHYAKVCKSKASVKAISSNDTSFLGAVLNKNLKEDKWLASIFVGNKEIEFKVDTGADVNILPSNLFDQLFPNVHLIPVDRCLMGPDGKHLKTRGMFFTDLKYFGKTVKENIYVVPHAEKALLSGNTSEELGILRRLCHVSSEDSTCKNFDPVKEFPQLFLGLGSSSMKYKIVLESDAKPYALTTPRRVPIPLLKKVKNKLGEMEQSGVIEPVEEPSDWCSPMVIVPKPDGDIRICVDLSKLNKYIKREIHPMPVSEHILAQLGQAKYFSKLDAYWGFWQVGLEDESQILTTFISPFGRYKFKRLPFGITSAPEFFQKKMSQILSGLDGVVCNIDDILIHGETKEEHDLRLKNVLKVLAKAGITLNQNKCHFHTQSVKYLGHTIDEQGIHPDENKVRSIVEMSSPKNVTELKSFLGMVNYLSKFIPDAATISNPLNCLLKSSSVWRWDVPQQNAFKLLKEKLSSAPVLAKFDPTLEITVSADASSYGLGAVLKQRQPDGNVRPVAYSSRTLNSCEKKYAQIEKEGLAIVWACERFRDYITGIKIKIETDHKPLIAIFGSKMLDEISPRLQRMRLRLMRYFYDIFHTPGKLLIVADVLSRKPLQETEDKEFEDEIFAYVRQIINHMPMSDQLLENIKVNQENDSVCEELRNYVKEGWPERSKISDLAKPFWQYRNEISEIDGILLKCDRLIIPVSLRKDIMSRIHEGHLGITKCRMRAKMSVWWPGLSSKIREEVTSCEKCARETVNNREPLLPSKFPERPWQKIAMDLFYLEKKWYLLVTDYYSRYPELVSLDGLSASSVISHIKSIFARHGIPEVVYSDNGPQFLPEFSSEFSKFAREWNFRHITSSPRYPQSNGFVESAVKIIKRSIKKEGNSYLALLSYRSTPLENGFTPAELLFGRKLRSRLPIASHMLQPYKVNHEMLTEVETRKKEKQKEIYDKRHRASNLSILLPEKRVWITDMKEEGVIVRKAETPRSYIVQTPRGRIRRNRFHLLPLRGYKDVQEDPPYESPSTICKEKVDQMNPSINKSIDHQPVVNDADVSETLASTITETKGTITTRSGRTVNKPKRLDL